MCSSWNRLVHVQNHVTLSFKVTHMGVGGMNSLSLWTSETKNDLQDSMLRSRYTPNDYIGHEFDAMTPQKCRYDVRIKRHRMMSLMLFWQGVIFRKSHKRKFVCLDISQSYRWHYTSWVPFDPNGMAKANDTDLLLDTFKTFASGALNCANAFYL